MTRQDVAVYLQWLADQPDGVAHRAVLFRAALIINRDASVVIVDTRNQNDATHAEN